MQQLYNSIMLQPLVSNNKDIPSYSSSSSDNNSNNNNNSTRLLAANRRPVGVRSSGGGGGDDEETIQQLLHWDHSTWIIFPWMPLYKIWWSLTAIGAIITVFVEPYQVAFHKEAGSVNDWTNGLAMLLTGLFALDILVNFHLAVYKDEMIVYERKDIRKQYLQGTFWLDFIGVVPFESMALMVIARYTSNPDVALYASLFRLLRFVRLHRMKKLSDTLQYNARVSLLWFTLARNIGATIACTHIEACGMYFLARLNDFEEATWLGPKVHGMSGFARYITALYLNVTTFCTVGYGDFAPANAAERTLGSCFMLANIVVAAWIVGSITLLIVKGDEKTGQYRDSLQTLHEYSTMHGFEEAFTAKLKTQLRLEFNNREIADEQVLKHFPSSVRRKILRRLYLQPLVKTQLMKGVRQQFVDAFLSSCTVEIFSPGEEIVERGSILADLFLLVGGIVQTSTPILESVSEGSSHLSIENGDVTNSKMQYRRLEAGDFIGEIGFFTESPQVESVSCLTVCKTLTMSRSAYILLAQDHPGSVGKILHNLLVKVEEKQLLLPKNLSLLRAGSAYDLESGYGTTGATNVFEEMSRQKEALTAVKELVQMHMSKQLDDQTTRLLFAASRGDTATISLMCDQGFSPNHADYDQRTALMVASMKGNMDVVKMLLEYKVSVICESLLTFNSSLTSFVNLAQANPNLSDMHGSTALYEAVKNGHESIIDLLLKHEANLCMTESLAASVLCQAVFDGDILLLKRLLRAGIQVDAADYDKRTAAHIAAAEGNASALKVLAAHGAKLSLKDRWDNTAQNEAEKSNVHQLLEFLSLK